MKTQLQKLICYYSFSAFISAFLDVTTTYIGVNWYNYVELNRFSNFSSMLTAVAPEVLLLIVGIFSIVIGFYFNKDLIKRCENIGAKKFIKSFVNPYTPISKYLIIIPIFVVTARVIPVINNLMYIMFGWGIVGAPAQALSEIFGISSNAALAIVYFAYAMAFYRLLSIALYRACFSSPSGSAGL
jgi:hypothetical protein